VNRPPVRGKVTFVNPFEHGEIGPDPIYFAPLATWDLKVGIKASRPALSGWSVVKVKSRKHPQWGE
jgi:hypothetical protein